MSYQSLDSFSRKLVRSRADLTNIDRKIQLTQSTWMRHTNSGVQVLNRLSYHQWQLRGANIIVDDLLVQPWYYPILIFSPQKDKILTWPNNAKRFGRSFRITSLGYRTQLTHIAGSTEGFSLSYRCLIRDRKSNYKHVIGYHWYIFSVVCRIYSSCLQSLRATL